MFLNYLKVLTKGLFAFMVRGYKVQQYTYSLNAHSVIIVFDVLILKILLFLLLLLLLLLAHCVSLFYIYKKRKVPFKWHQGIPPKSTGTKKYHRTFSWAIMPKLIYQCFFMISISDVKFYAFPLSRCRCKNITIVRHLTWNCFQKA